VLKPTENLPWEILEVLGNFLKCEDNTGLFEIIVGVLTTYHTRYNMPS